MLSFGWSEIIITIIIVIIVVGPKEIPNLLKQLGSFSKSLKKISRDFKSSLNEIANEGDLKEIKNSLSDIKDVKDNLNIKDELKNEISSIKETIAFTDEEINKINDKVKKN